MWLNWTLNLCNTRKAVHFTIEEIQPVTTRANTKELSNKFQHVKKQYTESCYENNWKTRSYAQIFLFEETTRDRMWLILFPFSKRSKSIILDIL